ncbi:hypothetical protein ACLI4Y_02890 [Natrialbaceae archaeon A-CW3]
MAQPDNTIESADEDGDDTTADPQVAVTGDGDDENELLKEWALFGGILLTIAGLGVGLFYILVDAIDQEVAETGSLFAWGLGSSVSTLLVVGAFVGVFVAWNVDVADDLAYKIAGATMAAGTFGFVVISVLFRSTTSDVSLEFAGLLINAAIGALVVGAVAAGGVWVARNKAPAAIGVGSTDEATAAPTAD